MHSPASTACRQTIPEGDNFDLLLRCYGYRLKRGGQPARDPTPPTPEELAEAESRGWAPRRKQRLTESEFLERLAAAMDKLDQRAVLGAFVAGVGGSAISRRQLPISHAWAGGVNRAIAAGDYGLADFGIGAPIELDYAHELLLLAFGNVWNERPVRFLADLESAAAQDLPHPAAADWAVFDRLIETIESQPPGLTPGGLGQVLAKGKVLPGTDKYQRYGILQALAELGVLPNPYLSPMLDFAVPVTERHAAERQVPGGSRSDIVLPLSGWRSDLGVDRVRLDRLFGFR